MKDLTCSVYTFEDLIKGNYLYIDKTEYLWKLVSPYKGICFLSRPRRFGKSLTLSTLKALFEGKKHLFKGLAITRTAYKWQEYPVIHFEILPEKKSPTGFNFPRRNTIRRSSSLSSFFWVFTSRLSHKPRTGASTRSPFAATGCISLNSSSINRLKSPSTRS
jgi:hypothetical protein